MPNHRQVFLWIISLLIVCSAPLLFFSEHRQQQISTVFAGDWASQPSMVTAAAMIGLFACDILLPIPATAVCAVAGKVFGIFTGSLVCWIGLNLSAAIGYGLARFIGWPAIRRFSHESAVAQVKFSIDRFGIWPLVAMRPIPVLAEASVLLLGLYRYPLRQFWPPVVISNLVVATVFVAMGNWFAHRDLDWVGIMVASLIPVAMLAVWGALHRIRNIPSITKSP